jgi:ATP-dependent RNA helicase DDX27
VLRSHSAVTLVGEADRRLLKTALKRSPASQVKHRLIPPEVVSSMITQLDELKGEVEEVMKEEREEKAMRTAEMELTKGSNMIEHRDEIMSRPKRTWFQSEKDKLEAKSES